MKTKEFWLSNSEELTFFDERRYSDGYGGVSRSMDKISPFTFIKHIQQRKASEHFLVIKCEMKGRTIPMVDCDTEEDTRKAIEYITSKGLGFAHFHSSQEKSWIFPGFSFSTFAAAFKAVADIPGCDDRYRKCAKKRGFYVVRGECKNEKQVIPTLENLTTKEPCVTLFANALEAHFKSQYFANVLEIRKTTNCFAERKAYTTPSIVIGGGY